MTEEEKMQRSSDVEGQHLPKSIVTNDGTVNPEAKGELLARMDAMTKQITSFEENSKGQQHERQGQKGFRSYFPSYYWGETKILQMFLDPKVRFFENFTQALLAFCKSLPYPCEIRDKILDCEDKHPLFVICPASTRSGPDIDHVLKGLNWKKNFAVLVIHSRSEDTLPQLPTSTYLHGKDKYKHITFIDFAFTEESQFYTCEMNVEGKKKLLEFANK